MTSKEGAGVHVKGGAKVRMPLNGIPLLHTRCMVQYHACYLMVRYGIFMAEYCGPTESLVNINTSFLPREPYIILTNQL